MRKPWSSPALAPVRATPLPAYASPDPAPSRVPAAAILQRDSNPLHRTVSTLSGQGRADEMGPRDRNWAVTRFDDLEPAGSSPPPSRPPPPDRRSPGPTGSARIGRGTDGL